MLINDMASFIPTVHARVITVLSAHDADAVKRDIFHSGQHVALNRLKKAFKGTKVTSNALKDPLGCFRVSWESKFGAIQVIILLNPEGWQVEAWGWDEKSQQWIIGCATQEPTLVSTKPATEAPQAQE
jgi:hypothetical protein